MNRLTFNLLFFIIIVPLKLYDIYLEYPQKFEMFFEYPIESIIYNIDNIIQFATIGYSPIISLLVLIIISLFRFNYIGMSKWYSLALFVPIWNLYLIYRLISTRDKESNDKIGIVKEVEIKNIQTKEKDITLNEIKNLNNKIIELEKINKILKLENNTKSLELENLNYRIKELEKNIEYLEVKYNNKIKYLNKKNNSYKDNKVFNNNYLKKVIESKSIYKTHYIIIGIFSVTIFLMLTYLIFLKYTI